MENRAIKFSLETDPVVIELPAESPQNFLESTRPSSPSVFVVVCGRLDDMRRLTDIVVDRGRKHKAKQLTYYFLAQQKIPLLDGESYTTTGQLQRSIRDFLLKARRATGSSTYILAVREALFEELLRVSTEQPSGEGGSADFGDSGSVLDELPPNEIPADLLQSYVGDSPACRVVRHFIVQWAKTNDPVVILGESGTGKEVVAKAIHQCSARSQLPFVQVNCAAIPKELFESEVFGTVEGAATSVRAHAGYWEQANSGTLFLDEIGDLSLDHQGKILIAIENQRIQRVGATKPQKVDVRVIAATNVDLESAVHSGLFRDDLYNRLSNMLTIRTPALREHPEDVPLIALRLWKKIAGDDAEPLSSEVLDELRAYEWRGNVRDLRGTLIALRATYKDLPNLRFGVKHLRTTIRIRKHDPKDSQIGLNTGVGSLSARSKGFGQCFLRLQQVAETLRVFRNTAKVIDTNDTEANRSKVAKSLQYRLSELEQLCNDPLLLHRKETFDEVHGVVGELKYFQGIIRADTGAAHHWKASVGPKLDAVLNTISKELTWLRDHIYEPRPIDNSAVAIPDDLLGLMEDLARNNHDVWAKRRIDEGWTYGPVRDDVNKKNPDIRLYDELPDSEKQYDRDSVIQSLKTILAMGYRIAKE